MINLRLRKLKITHLINNRIQTLASLIPKPVLFSFVSIILIIGHRHLGNSNIAPFPIWESLL